jgi:hypothetical protein
MPVSWIPAEPPVPPEQRAKSRFYLRYEDVSQDGRLVVEACPEALGAVWRHLAKRPLPAFSYTGVVPILSRVCVVIGDGPISAYGPAEADGMYQLAHTVGDDGEVDKVLLNMWVSVHGQIGTTYPPSPANAGTPIVAARVFAEHVFTRPFAPAAQRKVRALEMDEGKPVVPEARCEWRPPEALLALPEGAVALDEAEVADEGAAMFGLDHTDSNQHVNSLVYPRLFIEAALRRFHAHGRGRPARAARAMEIAYRKPCFAGEIARVSSRAFAAGDRLGVVASLSAEGDTKPRCTARLVFDR